MKKILVITAVILLAVTPLVLAGFFDTITGKVVGTDAPANVTVNIRNTAPSIIFVNASLDDIGINLNQTSIRNVTINFTVYDSDQSVDINHTSGFLYLNGPAGSACTAYLRNSTNTCVNTTAGAHGQRTMNFTCNVIMKYYDCFGTWTVNASASDLSDNSTYNDTYSFQVNALQSVDIYTDSVGTDPYVDFGTLAVFSENNSALTNTTANNTGNVNVTNLQVNGTDLVGTSNNTYSIIAPNFTLSTSGVTITNPCNLSDSTINGQQLSTNAYINVTSLVGSGSANPNPTVRLEASNVDQDVQIRYCFLSVPEVIKQNYTTAANGAWTINAFPI